MRFPSLLAAALTLAAPLAAHAILVCDLDGQPIDPANGHTTAHKTGMMHCRDGAGGLLQRDQELRDGVFMGTMRYYRKGVLQSEFTVNERGNRDGRSRDWAGTAPENPLLSEETASNGTTVGLARRWYPNGVLRRATFYGTDGREQAVAEFTDGARLSDLRCGPAPQLAPAVDDTAWCGFRSGAPVSTELYAHKGYVNGRVSYQRGELRLRESLSEDGKPQRQLEIDAAGGAERDFGANGTLRREKRWVTKAKGDERPQRIVVLEREFHESGTLVREKRWTPEPVAALVLEQQWYLNGQPREKQEYSTQEGRSMRHDTRYHDNGQLAFDGHWLLKGRYDTLAVGTHKSFDDAGRLRSERIYDERGRVAREREIDETGRVQRDDEVFEDGSRKAYAR